MSLHNFYVEKTVALTDAFLKMTVNFSEIINLSLIHIYIS